MAADLVMGAHFLLAAFMAGKIETIIVIKIEHTEIRKIEPMLISDGIVLRK